jgi:hypothetical protein
MKILNIKIIHDIDECPDLSFLGEYSSTRAKFSFDRQVLGHMGRNEYRYFNPAQNPFHGKTQAEKKEIAKYAKEDYERFESFNNQNWHMIGIWASAKIQVTKDGPIQTIRSGGLWGIESDSDRQYIDQVESEETSTLSTELQSMGFKRKYILKALENIQRPD